MDRGDVALRALLGPLDRAVQPPRQGEADRLLGVRVELRPEAAAHVGGHHAQLGLGDAAGDGLGGPHDVGDLAGGVHRVLAHRHVGLHDHPARLHGVRDEAPQPVAVLHLHEVGVVEEGLGRLVRERASRPSRTPRRSTRWCRSRRARAARRPPSRRAGRSRPAAAPSRPRPARRRPWRARGVSATTTATPSPTWRALSLASGQCSLILMSSVTGQAQTSGAAHSAARSAPLNAATQPSMASAFDTSTPLIARVREGAAHDVGPEHPGDRDVVDVAGPAGDELGVLLAELRGADRLLRAARWSPSPPPRSSPRPRRP